jgi:4-amino-4-deoxy-L-arabinose transferase-like glycosyltransferase
VLLFWILFFFLSGLLFLKVFPPVNYNIGDEIWAMERGAAYVKGTYRGDFFHTSRIYFLSVGAFLTLFGKSVYTARALSLVAGTFSLYLVYRAGKVMADEKVGFTAALLLGSNYLYSWHSKVARHEMLTVVFVLSAFLLLLHVHARRRPEWLLFLSGLLITLSVHVNSHNVQYNFGMLALFAWLFRNQLLSRATGYFAGGLFAGGAIWMGALAIFTLQGTSSVTAGYPVPVLEHGFLRVAWYALTHLHQDYLVNALRVYDHSYLNTVSASYYFLLTATFLAFSLFTDGRRTVCLLLGFLLVSAFSLYFFAFKLGFYHVVEFVPFISLALAVAIHRIGEKLGDAPPLGGRRWVGLGTAWLMVALLTAPGLVDAALSYKWTRPFSYERLIERVSGAVPPGSRVMGSDLYQPAFPDEDFEHMHFGLFRREQCPEFEGEALGRSVQYVLLDDLLRYFAENACGREYVHDMLEFLLLDAETVAVIDEHYPNELAQNQMITDIYIIKLPSPAEGPAKDGAASGSPE